MGPKFIQVGKGLNSMQVLFVAFQKPRESSELWCALIWACVLIRSNTVHVLYNNRYTESYIHIMYFENDSRQ